MFTADPWMLLPPPRPPHPAHVNLPRHNQVPYYVSTRHSNVQDFQDVQDFSLKNLSHLCVKIYRIQIPMAGYFNGENDDHPMDGSGHQGFTYWRHGISGRKIDHWTTHDPSTGWKCRKCYLIIIHGIKWNLEIEKPPNESSYHIISYHIIDLHSSSSIPKNLIKICAAHHPPPFLTQPASSPHPVSTEFGVAAPVLLMVTPRSCSSARVSVKRASPAALALMMPALQILTWGEPLCISRNPSRNQENPKKMERKVERNQKFGLTCFFWWNCGWFHRFKYTNYTILQRTSCFCINVCVM